MILLVLALVNEPFVGGPEITNDTFYWYLITNCHFSCVINTPSRNTYINSIVKVPPRVILYLVVAPSITVVTLLVTRRYSNQSVNIDIYLPITLLIPLKGVASPAAVS